MSARRALVAVLVFAAGFAAGHFLKRGGPLSPAGHPSEITVTYPQAGGSGQLRTRVTLRVWQVWERGEPTNVGRSSEHPRQWAITAGGTTYFASPVE